MNILAFTRYGRTGASSRLRFMQYGPELEAMGCSVQYEQLFLDGYIDSLQSGQSRRYMAVKSLLSRILTLRNSQQFEVLWIEKDALPWLPAFLELSLIPKHVPLVLDYDDAVFHQYDLHPNLLVSQILGGKHQALMRRAALVIAGNPYIAEYAKRAGARSVELLPTVVDLARYWPAPNQSVSKPTVGWIGQRSTAAYLKPLAQLFERLCKEKLMQFLAVGIDAHDFDLPMDSEAWSEETEVASIQQMDVGIMPLEDSSFERGKCGYKLIQYMACGLPVVASPVGVNASIVEHGVNGFLATTVDEWEQALRALAVDPALRRRMGQAGRGKVEREYCLRVTAPRLTSLLFEAARGKRA